MGELERTIFRPMSRSTGSSRATSSIALRPGDGNCGTPVGLPFVHVDWVTMVVRVAVAVFVTMDVTISVFVVVVNTVAVDVTVVESVTVARWAAEPGA